MKENLNLKSSILIIRLKRCTEILGFWWLKLIEKGLTEQSRFKSESSIKWQLKTLKLNKRKIKHNIWVTKEEGTINKRN